MINAISVKAHRTVSGEGAKEQALLRSLPKVNLFLIVSTTAPDVSRSPW